MRFAFLDGKGQLLDVLDVVHAGVAGHDQAQRAAMGQRHGLAVHLPGQQRVLHGRKGHGALHQHTLGIEACGQHLSARSRHVDHAVGHSAQGLDHIAHGHTAPDHATSSTHRPLRTAGLGGEEGATVARALQHHGHGLQTHGLEFTHAQLSGLFHTIDLHRPCIAIGHDGLGRRGQVVAHIELVGGRDHAGAKRAALGLDGGGAVHDHGIGILEAGIAR